MFSKRSRYNKLTDVVTTDAGGRSIESKSIRLLPEVTGTFYHVIEEVDRLDHLAYKYYKQPLKWWRICDANPQFLSPLALLGEDPLVTARFTVTFDDSAGPPPWYKIQKNLRQTLGIRDVSIEEEVSLEKQTKQLGPHSVEVNAETFIRVVVVTYNRLSTTGQDIKSTIEAEGFVVEDPQVVGRLGKEIVIPPDAVG